MPPAAWIARWPAAPPPSRRIRSTPSRASSLAARSSSSSRAASRGGRSAAAGTAARRRARRGTARKLDQCSAWAGAGGRRSLGRPARQGVHQRGHARPPRSSAVWHVHLAHLDRAQPRVQAHVPPHVRVVLGPAAEPDRRRASRSTRPSRQRRRHAAAGVGADHRRARAGQAGVAAEPERASRRPSAAEQRQLQRAGPLSARTAASGSGMPTCTCSAHSGVRWIRPRMSPFTRR